jgi:predicted glutamine amidotransferase
MFIKTESKVLTRSLFYALSLEDAKLNQDGYGFLSDGIVTRTHLCPTNITNLGGVIRENVNSDRILGHVRLASRGVPVVLENVHPFDLSNLVGAHNGTLWFDGETPPQYGVIGESRESDSLRFLTELNTELDHEDNIVTAFNSVMKNVRGKFAFLIYLKKSNKYYAIRGNSADLHLGILYDKEDKQLGYAVNTLKTSLEDAIFKGSNVSQLCGGVKIERSVITELSKNTIFELKETGPEEVGKCIENPITTYQSTTSSWSTDSASTRTGAYVPVGASTRKEGDYSNNFQPAIELAKWADKQSLSPADIDLLFVLLMGITVLDSTAEDIAFFTRVVIPKVSAPKMVLSYMEKKNITALPSEFFKHYKLQFPIGLNKNINEVVRCLKDYSVRGSAVFTEEDYK